MNTRLVDSNARERRLSPCCGSFCRNAKHLITRSLPFALSLTFSWQVLIIGLLAVQLDDSPKHQSVVNWIQTIMTVCLAIALTPLHGVNYQVSYQLGRLKQILDPDDEFTIGQLHHRGQLRQLMNDQAHMQNNLEDPITKVRSLFQAGVIMSPCLFILGVAPLYYSGSFLTNVTNVDKEVAHQAQSFLRPYGLAVGGLTLRMCFEQILYATHSYGVTMLGSLLGLGIGTGVAAGLSFSSLDWGMEGIAYGFAVDSILTAFIFGTYLATNQELQVYKFFRYRCGQNSLANATRSILRYGLSQLVSDSAELGMTFSLAATAACLGHENQAAWQVVMQIAFFCFPLFLASSLTTGQQIEALRASQPNTEKIKQWIGHTSVIVAGYTGTITLGSAALINAKPGWFGVNNDEVDDKLDSLAYSVGSGLIFDALRLHQLHTLKGLGCNCCSTTFTAGSLAIGTILAYFNSCSGHDNGKGISNVAQGYLTGMLLSYVGLLFTTWPVTQQVEASMRDQRAPLLNDQFTQNDMRRGSLQSGTSQLNPYTLDAESVTSIRRDSASCHDPDEHYFEMANLQSPNVG